MSALLVDLPQDLRAELAARAARRGISESAWLEEAVRERLAAAAELEYLEQRAARGSRDAFQHILAKVPPTEPMPGDER